MSGPPIILRGSESHRGPHPHHTASLSRSEPASPPFGHRGSDARSVNYGSDASSPIVLGGQASVTHGTSPDRRHSQELPEEANSEDLEAEEEPQDLIAPSSDVFSYFLLTAPGERKKHGRFTVDACTSYILVFSVLFIQCILLFCVWHRVIGANVDWMAGIMNTGKDWNIVGQKQTGCNDGSSLCVIENGTFTCAPPSVQLIGRWDDLDTNKDGVWTRQECIHSRETLKCSFGVDPLEVFDMIGGLLQNRESEKYIWVHPDVQKGIAISRDYFTYIMGDVAMCSYRNGDMCGNLVKRGFFDAAIMSGKIPRVGTTVRSALTYCHALLDYGGICERYMPSAYATWKIESVSECSAASYKKFVYKDPNSGRTKSLLSVDYDARQSYEVAQTPVFLVYKTCIIFIWMLLIVHQLRDVQKTLAWIHTIPLVDEDNGEYDAPSARTLMRMDSSRRRAVLKDEEIHKITRSHRAMLTVVNLTRLCILCTLLYVGLNFLAKQNDYIGLLLDGVAMIFIVEVQDILYSHVIRQDVRQTWEERSPMPFTDALPPFGASSKFRPRADILDLAWFFILLSLASMFMAFHLLWVVKPLYGALQCTCLSEGSQCREAHAFSYQFWQQYWMLDLPSSIMRINEAQYSYGAASLLESTAKSHVGRIAGNLLKGHHALQP